MINILENGNVYIDEVTCIDFSMCVDIFVKYVTTPEQTKWPWQDDR